MSRMTKSYDVSARTCRSRHATGKIQLTLERGAVDNVTVVVARYTPESALHLDADASARVVPE